MSNTTSDTPRTDAAADFPAGRHCVDINVSRALERELSSLRDATMALMEWASGPGGDSSVLHRIIAQATAALDKNSSPR